MQKSINHLQELYSNWTRLSSNNGNQEQLKWTTDEIKSSIKTIDWDIQDLEETIKIVESNPQKFKLDMAEVQRRKQFIQDSKSRIQVRRISMICKDYLNNSLLSLSTGDTSVY